jgi:hypothetical protein
MQQRKKVGMGGERREESIQAFPCGNRKLLNVFEGLGRDCTR